MPGEFRVQQVCRTWIDLCNAPVCDITVKSKEKEKKEGGGDGKPRARDFFFLMCLTRLRQKLALLGQMLQHKKT